MLIRALHPRTLMFLNEDAGGGGGEGGGNNAAPQTFTQEQVNALLAREKGKFQQKYGDYDTLKAAADELKTLKAASQTDLERLTGETNTLKGQNGTLSTENMRLKVALKLGFTGDRAELAGLLQGSNEAEMEEHGKKLAAMFKGGGTGFDGGTRGTGEQVQSADDWIRRAAGRT